MHSVPFEEDAKDSSIWFLDHNYLEQLHTMFKKVNARENIIGWYSTGVKVRSSDLEINELFRKYIANPILVVIDPVGGTATLGLPTKSYVAVDEVAESRDGVARSQRTFRHIGSSLGALEAEEVGVEHLLRDIRRLSTATLGQAVEARVAALRSLDAQLAELRRYVADVREGRLPLSQRIVAQLQHAFNLAPAVNQPALAAAFASSTNDALLAIYTASLTRAIISLHTLLLNKRDLRERDRKDAAAEEAAALAKANAKDKATSTTTAATTSDRTEKGWQVNNNKSLQMAWCFFSFFCGLVWFSKGLISDLVKLWRLNERILLGQLSASDRGVVIFALVFLRITVGGAKHKIALASEAEQADFLATLKAALFVLLNCSLAVCIVVNIHRHRFRGGRRGGCGGGCGGGCDSGGVDGGVDGGGRCVGG
jgi:26S proteasome regulatory subunit N8